MWSVKASTTGPSLMFRESSLSCWQEDVKDGGGETIPPDQQLSLHADATAAADDDNQGNSNGDRGGGGGGGGGDEDTGSDTHTVIN